MTTVLDNLRNNAEAAQLKRTQPAQQCGADSTQGTTPQFEFLYILDVTGNGVANAPVHLTIPRRRIWCMGDDNGHHYGAAPAFLHFQPATEQVGLPGLISVTDQIKAFQFAVLNNGIVGTQVGLVEFERPIQDFLLSFLNIGIGQNMIFMFCDDWIPRIGS